MSSRKLINLVIFSALIIILLIISESSSVIKLVEDLNMVLLVGGSLVLMYVLILLLPVSFLIYISYRFAKFVIAEIDEHTDFTALKHKFALPLIGDRQFSVIVRITLVLTIFILASSLYIRGKNPTDPAMLQRTTLISISVILLTGFVVYPCLSLTASPIRRKLASWSKSHYIRSITTMIQLNRRRIRIAIAFALPVAALYATAIYGIPQFFERDPAACAFCHVHKTYFESWKSSTHQKASCTRCHRDHIDFSIKSLTTKDPVKPLYDYSHNCYSCHSYNSLAAGNCSMHARKLRMNCSDCHSSTGHGYSYIMASRKCTTCHKDINVSLQLDPAR